MMDNPRMSEADEILSWMSRYELSRLTLKRETTRRTYTLILQQFLTWLGSLPNHAAPFDPLRDLTATAVQTYLFEELAGTSISHRERTKSILSSFAEWLIDERLLTRNPTRGIEFPAQQLLAPRELVPDQRYILKELVEAEDLRGQAIFALGYYTGCRASDVCWFRLDQVHHLTKKEGSITVGYKRGQLRTLDLAQNARKPLRTYLEKERSGIQTTCPFLFLSQREHPATTRLNDHPRRLTEGGLHAWWRTVKERATRKQWEQIADITFHDLRHDFGHRLRAAGFSLEEVAVMLGHVTRKGTPAVATTARYTQPNREHIKHKLRNAAL
ncbi:MAG TPA: tyrosine-type recombinase/integrase [Ktedonosporobacter sp.]|jgi:site-specific recombinase XerD|nr:tyrosine-type recombinase/integrase [Ktedonosporobacter sp.]